MKKISLPQEGIATLYGAHDGNLKHIESLLGVAIRTQGDELIVEGEKSAEQRVERIFDQLKTLMAEGYELRNGDVKTAAQLIVDDGGVDLRDYFLKGGQKQPEGTKRRVNPKSTNQRRYLDAIEKYDIVFGVGPAGTGKTYLAMAQAVSFLLAKKVSRIILARPAVEAGEKLGFLPGDLQEKVNPYLRPLYDALTERLGTKRLKQMLADGIIEIAPVAYMRGRTLSECFVVIDEAQNCTYTQIKMLLTRLGWRSTMVLTGDPDQTDLLPGISGLAEIASRLEHVPGIPVVRLAEGDIVRHPLVASMLTVL